MFALRFEKGVSYYREPNAEAAWGTFATGYGPTKALAASLGPDRLAALSGEGERQVQRVHRLVLADRQLGGAHRLADQQPAEHVPLEADGLARFKLPEQLVVLDALPMTASGKVQKHEIVRLLAEAGA